MRGNTAAQITDENVLYLNEDKKKVRGWLQVCGIKRVPLDGVKYGLIRSIAFEDQKSNPQNATRKESRSSRESTDAVMAYRPADYAAAERGDMDAGRFAFDRIRTALTGGDGRTLSENQRKVYEDLAGRLDVMMQYYRDAVENVRESEGTAHSGAKFSYSEKDGPKNIETLTEQDELDLLESVERGDYADRSYIPLRRNTPGILIAVVERYTNGKTTVQDLPIISEVGHLRQSMDEDSGSYNPKHRPHNISPTEMISIIKGMEDPRYIVLQDNGRYVEVIRYRGETRGRASWAVLDFDQEVDKPYLNGYPSGTYNVLVTPFEPDDLENYMRNHVEAVIYDKAKDSPARGSNRLWSSHASGMPFAENTVSQSGAYDKHNTSTPDRGALEWDMQRPADYADAERGDMDAGRLPSRPPSLYDLAYAMYSGDTDRLYRQLSTRQTGPGGGPEPEPEPIPAPEPEREPDPEPVPAPSSEREPAPVSEPGVDYLSILDLGYGPLSAAQLRDLIEMGKVERVVEDGRVRFRRADRHRPEPDVGDRGEVLS